jgi:hypothetical protein
VADALVVFWYNTLQYSTVQYSTVQYSIVLYGPYQTILWMNSIVLYVLHEHTLHARARGGVVIYYFDHIRLEISFTNDMIPLPNGFDEWIAPDFCDHSAPAFHGSVESDKTREGTATSTLFETSNPSEVSPCR